MESNFIPNSTQVPNIILDMIIPRISEADGKCLLYICRRTYGFHRERDRISLSQFIDGIVGKENKRLDHGTGLSRPAVVEAIKNLVESGVIKVIRTTGGNYYEMNIDLITDNGDEVVNKVNQLRKLTRSSKVSKPKQVNLLNLQKKGKKEKESIVSPIKTLVDYFFELKGWGNKEKDFYKQNKIIYGRYTKPAKELLFLCDGDINESKSCIDKISIWAKSRELDWSLETIFKKWYDLDGLKPKEKKPYYENNRAFKDDQGRWQIITPNGEFKHYVGKESAIEYR